MTLALRTTVLVGVLGAVIPSTAVAQVNSSSQATSAPTDQSTSAAPSQTLPTSNTPSTPGVSVATPMLAIPPFDWGGAVRVSEGYTSNAGGIAGETRPDYISSLGLNAFVHEHSRSVVLDANYTFNADFYARGTEPTQISNNLQAVGSVSVVPEYLTVNAKAFAAPVVESDVGIVTAGDRIVPNGFRNSYGYYVEPDFRLRLGDFASSDTAATYGSTFFTTPAGSAPIVIPGLPGPQDTNVITATQTFTSGDDFDRLNWKVVGDYSETQRHQGVFIEKAGIADLKYAINHEYSLLATVGYDALTNTTPLTHNVSGLVAMGGVGLTFGQSFSFFAEAGRKYNSASYIGSLRYDLSPTASLVGSANDSVATPESQLLNSLSTLTSTADGTLTTNDNLLANGMPASLSSFSPESFGNISFDQNISRYQTLSLSFLEDFDRNHADLTLFGTRRTILTLPVIGPPTTESWGTNLQLSRDINPLLLASIGGSYMSTQELGGTAHTFTVDANVQYTLTREMAIFLQGMYLDRQSSASLIALSPFTGSLTDYRITIGLTHKF